MKYAITHSERDEWLNRQALQAVLLGLCYYLAVLAVDLVFGSLSQLCGWARLYGAQSAMGTLNAILDGLLYAVLLACCALAVVRVLGGKEAGLPYLAHLAGGESVPIFASKPKPAPAYPYAPPTRTAAAGAPFAPPYAQPQPPSRPAPAEPGSAGRTCPFCSAPLRDEARFCAECGAKVE